MVATPIGNLRDITLRALDVLRAADLILAEDTRVARKLLTAHAISPKRLLAYHEHDARAGAAALETIQAGGAVALISDAGTPLLSDPGYPLVRDAAAAGHRVAPIPGASAMLAALTASGLPATRVLFAGFAPPKTAARRTFLATLAPIEATLVLFETGPRLAESLRDMAEVLGPRPAAVCRELTKLFEEIRRGSLAELAEAAPGAETRGEHVIVVGPPLEEEESVGAERLDETLRAALAEQSLKDAAATVAEALGLPRREVYARALALKAGDAGAG